MRHATIRSKLIASLLAPLLVLAVLALLGIRANLQASARAAGAHERAELASSLGPLVHELQGERALSWTYVSSRRAFAAADLQAQRDRVDQAAAAYRLAAGRVAAGAALRARIAYGLAELRRLPEQRAAVDRLPITAADTRVAPRIEVAEEEGEEHLQAATAAGHGAIDTPGKALDQYSDVVNDLLDINTQIAPGAGDERLLQAVAASVALARAKDFAALQRGLLDGVLRAGRFGPGQYGRLTALLAAQTVYAAQFANAATPAARAGYEQVLDRPAGRQVVALQARAAAAGDRGELRGDAATWSRAMGAELDGLREVEQAVGAEIAASSLAAKRGADRRALASSLLLAGALLLALALALVTAGSLIRPLGRLKAAAHEVARVTLPGVVRRLQDGEPVDLDAESAAPIASRSRDEIGQLADAFNDVHRVAVQVAGKEAALRRSVGDMFLNLARRSQSLIDRQLELIDGLRRGRPDEVAAGLGELDHLATRMRRNAENLIVLSGEDSARRLRGPVGLVELVGAAVGEIKEHTRVELLPLDDVRVAGHVAADVAHLLAELIENAVAFSAPGTKALVGGQSVPSGYLLQIEDQGIGMTDEQLVRVNQDLANPPTVDVGLARMLGFYVVRQLASRHGIRVQLRRSWYGGITALVLLPPGLLQLPPELAGSQGHLAAETAGRPDPDWPGGRAPMVHFPLRHHLVPARRGDARRPGVSGGSAGR